MKRYLPILAIFPIAAHAAVPANVTAALNEALSDATTVASLALIIVVAIAAFRYMRSAVR